jgi:hypothetical protein
MGECGQGHALDDLPILLEVAWNQDWSELVRETLPSPGFDLRTSLPVACRYTD